MDSEAGLLAPVYEQPHFGGEAEPPFKRARPDEEGLVPTLTCEGGALDTLPEESHAQAPYDESAANSIAAPGETMLLPAEGLAPAPPQAAHEEAAPAEAHEEGGQLMGHEEGAQLVGQEEGAQLVAYEAEPGPSGEQEHTVAIMTDEAIGARAHSKPEAKIVCPLWPKGGNITCTNPNTNPAGLRDKKVILDGREYTLCRSHANKLRHRLRADDGEEAAANWLRDALIKCGMVVEERLSSLTSVNLSQHNLSQHAGMDAAAMASPNGGPYTEHVEHVGAAGTDGAAVIEAVVVGAEAEGVPPESGHTLGHCATQAVAQVPYAEHLQAYEGAQPMMGAGGSALMVGGGGELMITEAGMQSLVFPAQKEKPQFSHGPRTIYVWGGEGQLAAAIGGRTSVVLPPTAGLRELKTLIRKTFGRYAYHKLGRLLLVATGVITDVEVTREHLVEGAIVHCTYTHTTGNQSLPPGGRPKSMDGSVGNVNGSDALAYLGAAASAEASALADAHGGVPSESAWPATASVEGAPEEAGAATMEYEGHTGVDVAAHEHVQAVHAIAQAPMSSVFVVPAEAPGPLIHSYISPG